MIVLLSVVLATRNFDPEERPSLRIVDPPRSFLGITLGKSDYKDAYKLFGPAIKYAGAHPRGNREVDLRGGIVIQYQGFDPPIKSGNNRGYLIDGIQIEKWNGHLPAKLLKAGKLNRVLTKLRHGDTLEKCRSLLEKYGVRYQLISTTTVSKGAVLSLDFLIERTPRLMWISYYK